MFTTGKKRSIFYYKLCSIFYCNKIYKRTKNKLYSILVDKFLILSSTC